MPVIFIYPYFNRINSVPAGTSVSNNLYANMTALFHFDGNLTDSSPITNNTGSLMTPATLNTTTKKFGTASAYFDGNGGYINYNASTAYNFGFGDFTVEAWMYPESLAGSGPNADKFSTIVTGLGSNDGGGAWRWHFMFRNDGALAFENAPEQGAPNNYFAVTTPGAITTGKWQHVAVTRSAGVLRFFVDGVLIARTDSATTSGDTGSVGPLRIGRTLLTTYDYRYKGFVDEVRICKTARYTKSFTVPTEAFQNSASVLLMHMDGNNSGASFPNEASAVTVTRYGGAITSSTNKKFGVTSAYFDGTGDYLATSVSPAFGFGTGDYTAELWFNTATVAKQLQAIFDMRPSGSAIVQKPNVHLFGSTLTFSIGSTAKAQSAPIVVNTWNHMALTRKDGVTRLFVNGVLVGSPVADTTDYGTSNDIVLGALGDGRDAVASHFQGYMDEVRVIKGEAAYVENFTPSNIPFNTPTPSLLMQDGADGSTSFTDANGVAMNAFGNVKFSSEQAKFGTTSIKFDGAGDYLVTPSSTAYGFGLGDFTMETWFYPTNGAKATGALMDMRDPGNWQAMKPTVILTANTVTFLISGRVQASSGVLADNTWHHVAWSRVAGVSRFFINGVMVGSLADASNYASPSDVVFGQISEARTTFDGYFTGYMDGMRIMKGVGMYTENFTPPTSQF
jgi:hypothetical protein